MVKLFGLETTLHISFSLAAFVFSVVLYVLVCALGTDRQNRNLKFRTLTITIVIGNFISILDNIFRDGDIFDTPYWVELLLLLLVFLCNIFLVYYMAMYMEGFFRDFRQKEFFLVFNTALVFSSVVFTVAVYLHQILVFEGEEIVSTVPIFIRVILGYVYELYFLIYTIALFIVFRKQLNNRARNTSVAAFIVVIGSVLFELLNTFGIGSGILYNYFGAVIGLYIFYIGVETPDYQNLLQSLTDLSKARRAADEANRAKSDFLANMSHEIRTPINAILGMNEMILRDPLSEEVPEYARNIDVAGGKLLELINSILDFSKIEDGKMEIIPARYHVGDALCYLESLIRERAQRKNLVFTVNVDPGIPSELNGDENRITQIIMNLLTNAVKYTHEGSVTLTVEEWERKEGNTLLYVEVRDTGIGIRKSDMHKLFESFERLDMVKNRNIEGTGLGMSIATRLLELMGSKMNVKSVYGEGSVFSFELWQKVENGTPLGDYRSSAENREKSRRRESTLYAPSARILVVDDTRMNLIVVQKLLKDTGIVFDTAQNGEEALKLAEGTPYDVILMDQRMPGMDGVETLKALQSSKNSMNEHTPVICLTADAIRGARDRYLAEGFTDYLTKPVNGRDLEEMLFRYLPKEKLENRPEKEKAGKDEALLAEPLFRALKNEGVNIRQGFFYCGNSEELYREILAELIRDYPEREKKLERYYEAKDWENYKIVIHSLKSSTKVIGAEKLSALAAGAEAAAEIGDEETLLRDHETIMTLFRRLADVVKEHLPSENPESSRDEEAVLEFLPPK